jgi:hypothetical protein
MSSESTRRPALATLLLLTLVACGKQGDPVPRPRAIPQPAKDLVTVQRGDQIEFTLSYPASTMAGLPLAGVESATVYQAPWPAPVAGEKLTVTDADLEKLAKPAHVLEGAELTDAVVGGKLRFRLPLPEGIPVAAPAPAATTATTGAATPTTGAAAATPPAPAPAPPPAAPAAPPVATPAATPVTPATTTPMQPGTTTPAKPAATTPATTAAAAPVAAKAWIYAVRTKAKGGELSPFSNAVLLLPQPVPASPSDLSVTAKKEGVALHWTAPVGSTAGIVVLRREASTPVWGDSLAVLPAAASDHLDRTAAYGKRYVYTVISRSTATPPVESAPTSEREVDYRDVFAPVAPTALRALAIAGEVRLVWEASPDPDVAGYLLERADGAGDFVRLTPKPLDAVEYSDRSAPVATALRYRAIAVDREGNASEPSEIAESQGLPQ